MHLSAKYPDKRFDRLNACLEKAIAEGVFDGFRVNAGHSAHAPTAEPSPPARTCSH